MKKEKTVKTHTRKTKSGKTVTVKQHTAKYDAADSAREIAKRAGAGKEFARAKRRQKKVLTYLDNLIGDTQKEIEVAQGHIGKGDKFVPIMTSNPKKKGPTWVQYKKSLEGRLKKLRRGRDLYTSGKKKSAWNTLQYCVGITESYSLQKLILED